LHIPVNTNIAAQIVFAGEAVHMQRGYLWALNPKEPHGACNLGFTPRIHVILDCFVTPRLRQLLHAAVLPKVTVTSLPQLASCQFLDIKRQAARMVQAGFYAEAERILLSKFHQYSMPEGDSLRAVYHLYTEVGNQHRAKIWRDRCSKFLRGIKH
jgi:hypothetical protein